MSYQVECNAARPTQLRHVVKCISYLILFMVLGYQKYGIFFKQTKFNHLFHSLQRYSSHFTLPMSVMNSVVFCFILYQVGSVFFFSFDSTMRSCLFIIFSVPVKWYSGCIAYVRTERWINRKVAYRHLIYYLFECGTFGMIGSGLVCWAFWQQMKCENKQQMLLLVVGVFCLEWTPL